MRSSKIVLDWFDSLVVRVKSKETLTLAVMVALGLGATLVAVEFAKFLGFNFEILPIYPITVAVVLGALGLGYTRNQRLVRTLSSFFATESMSLVTVLSSSFVTRALFAAVATPFPDEYAILRILQSRPISNVGDFLVNYRAWVGDLVPHPPLGFLVMSGFYEILPTPFGARIPSIILSVSLVAIVYYIIKEIGQPKYALPAAAIFGFVPHTVLFLTVALTDIYLHFFGVLAVLMYLRGLVRRSWRYTILAGVALGASFWSKQALGGFWAVVMLGSTFLLPLVGPRLEKLARFTVSVAISATVFYPWALINPYAFEISVAGPIRYVTHVWVNPLLYRVFSPNIPAQQTSQVTTVVTLTTVATLTTRVNEFVVTFATTTKFVATEVTTRGPGSESQLSRLGEIFPILEEAGRGHISYPELIIQTPLWLTPLVILFAALAALALTRRRKRTEVFMLAWMLFPLAAMVPGIRDIRYLILFTAPVAYFAARGIKLLDKDRSIKFTSMLWGFILVFLLIVGVVAQQESFGVKEAGMTLRELGLENGRILTNWQALAYYVPQAKLYYALWGDATEIDRLLGSESFDAAVIFHQARASPRPVSEGVRKVIASHFRDHLQQKPSDFSWFEIFYNRIDQTQSPALQIAVSGTSKIQHVGPEIGITVIVPRPVFCRLQEA